MRIMFRGRWHKFHLLSVSWPYSCVKSLKQVGHSSLEIWAFVTPKIAPLDRVPCVCKDISSWVAQTLNRPKFYPLSVSWPYSCVKSLKQVGHSSLEIWAFVTPKIAPLDRFPCVCKDISSSAA